MPDSFHVAQNGMEIPQELQLFKYPMHGAKLPAPDGNYLIRVREMNRNGSHRLWDFYFLPLFFVRCHYTDLEINLGGY